MISMRLWLAVFAFVGVFSLASVQCASRRIVYLANPLGFSDAGRLFKDQILKPKLVEAGFSIVDPWTLADPQRVQAIMALPYGPEKRDAWAKFNAEIGHRNRVEIDNSDIIFAVLDGVDVDSGTAAEVGYAFARGKKVIGYRGDFRLSADNEGSTVNLQVEYFIRASGGTIITSLSELPEAMAEK